MLSRTADHLFWMARYIERAENTARMLDVNMQTALMPQSGEAAKQGWRAMLGISELQPAFDAKYDRLTQRDVLDFMVLDRSNSSSIASCLTQARENARAVRGTLTTELWETHNATFLELDSRLSDGMLEQDPGGFFEWVKYRSHLSRGVTIGTTLRDESFYFIRIGTFLERTDNTARLLDVKFHDAGHNMPSDEGLGEETRLDFYFWAAILRSVSAIEIYRKVYRDAITPARVAELLMLRATARVHIPCDGRSLGKILATAVPSIVRDLGSYQQFPWLFSVDLLAQAVHLRVAVMAPVHPGGRDLRAAVEAYEGVKRV